MRKTTACLLLVSLIALGGLLLGRAQARLDEAAVAKRVEAYLRYLFAWGPDTQISVGSFHESAIPGLYSAIVQVSRDERRGQEVVLVSADGRYLIRGDFHDSTADPFADNRDGITLAGHPTKGPADAPVVIVEYGDFQCATCAEFYPIVKKLMADRKDVRLVWKDLPLTRIHDWAMAAAVAAQCAHQQSPQAFWRLHDYFFENQNQLNKDNLAARLDAFAPTAGLDAAAFRACRADEKTRAAVEQSISEATELGLRNTPSIFINGRPLVGTQPRELLDQYIDYEISIRQQGIPR